MEVDILRNDAGTDEIEIKLRDMQCQLNMLTRADGSAMFSQGQTVVMTAVYGPVEGKMALSDIYKANVEVNFSPISGVSTVRERLRESIIRQTCEASLMLLLHPRATISLSIQEMQDFGGLLACSINACCLALLNSGLAMNFLFAAVYCAIKKDGEIILDPSTKELEDVVANLTFAFDSVSKNVISCTTDGFFSESQYQECLHKCEKASDNVFKYYRDIVIKYAKTI